MKTVLETIQGGTEYLGKHGIESARLNMELLLARLLGCPRMQLYVDFDRPLDEPVLAPLRELVRRRKEREPLQHLLGSVEFYGREFRIDGRALIPRPETEELVEKILARLRAAERNVGQLADIGCGSGVIGLSLAAELETPAVLADLSPEALALARENAEALGLDGRVRLVESDLFDALGEERFDVVAANLPYIASAELAGLDPEVAHDPPMALDGGASGYDVLERFVASVGRHVLDGGLVAMEVGAGQGSRLAAAFSREGIWDVTVEQDLSRNERFVLAEKRGAAGETAAPES